jgi:hypothetical protein
MGHKTILSVALVAVALFAYTGSTQAAERRAKAVTYESGQPKTRAYRKKRPLEVTISARRRGGYSYRASDVVNTYGGSPPPYAEIRQTPSGPFDSGFFFDSGIGPRGGNSPYLH